MIAATASLLLALAASQPPQSQPPPTPRAHMVQLLAARAYAAGACQRDTAASLQPAYPPDFPPKLLAMLQDAFRQGRDAPPGPGLTPARCTVFLADTTRQIDDLTRKTREAGQTFAPP